MNIEDLSYPEKYDRALPNSDWSKTYDPGEWNTIYLAGLFRMGLMLTTHKAYMLMGDLRYPGGKPMRAPRPHEDEPDLWPSETWVIYRD